MDANELKDIEELVDDLAACERRASSAPRDSDEGDAADAGLVIAVRDVLPECRKLLARVAELEASRENLLRQQAALQTEVFALRRESAEGAVEVQRQFTARNDALEARNAALQEVVGDMLAHGTGAAPYFGEWDKARAAAAELLAKGDT